MYCCDTLTMLVDRDLAKIAPVSSLSDGRILTEFNTEYFLVFGEERHSYVGLNYCPFCGKALSIDLWNREKKK